MKRQRSTAGPVLVASLLAGWFGYWLGQRKVSLPAPNEAPIVTMLACPAPPSSGPSTVAAAPERPKHRATIAPVKSPSNQLPTLAATDDHREQLLQYVRDRAATLQECVPAGHERLRMTVRLDVGAQGGVQRAQVVDGDAGHEQAGACVAARMQAWTLPRQWVQERQSLLMSVVL